MSDIFRGLTILTAPITKEKLGKRTAVDILVSIGLGDLIDCGDIDGINELMDERVLSLNGRLADIHYTVAGCIAGEPDPGVSGEVIIRVRAEVERF